METIAKCKVTFPSYCGFCGDAGIFKCGRCFGMYYCCKEHQCQHWPVHKLTCRKTSVQVSTNTNEPNPGKLTSSINFKETEKRSPSDIDETEQCSSGNFDKIEQCSPGNLNVTKKRDPSNLNMSEDMNIQTNLEDLCMKVIKGLNSAGICVLDHFMGTLKGQEILLDVQNLYATRTFEKIRLVEMDTSDPIENIRSDVVTWVTGFEPECINIQELMRKIDEMAIAINKIRDRGVLSLYKLLTRSQMMVACYPGNGTYYQKHVDNPDKDGRLITFVYYVNYNWDKKHGGVLRAYPTLSLQPLDIEPLFDRLVIFWSDIRVPHEVLPVYANRFALTLWYYDYAERQAFKKSSSKKTKNF